MKYPKLLYRDDGEIFKNNGDDTYSMVSTEMHHPYRWSYDTLEKSGFFKESPPKAWNQKPYMSWRECALEFGIATDHYISSGDDRKLRYVLKLFEKFIKQNRLNEDKI